MRSLSRRHDPEFRDFTMLGASASRSCGPRREEASSATFGGLPREKHPERAPLQPISPRRLQGSFEVSARLASVRLDHPAGPCGLRTTLPFSIPRHYRRSNSAARPLPATGTCRAAGTGTSSPAASPTLLSPPLPGASASASPLQTATEKRLLCKRAPSDEASRGRWNPGWEGPRKRWEHLPLADSNSELVGRLPIPCTTPLSLSLTHTHKHLLRNGDLCFPCWFVFIRTVRRASTSLETIRIPQRCSLEDLPPPDADFDVELPDLFHTGASSRGRLVRSLSADPMVGRRCATPAFPASPLLKPPTRPETGARGVGAPGEASDIAPGSPVPVLPPGEAQHAHLDCVSPATVQDMLDGKYSEVRWPCSTRVHRPLLRPSMCPRDSQLFWLGL